MAKRCANCNAVFMNDEVKFCAKCGSPDFVPVHAEPAEAAPVAEAPAAYTAPVAQEAPAEPTAQGFPVADDDAITGELKPPVADTAAPAAPVDEWAKMSAEIQNGQNAVDNGAPTFNNVAPAYEAVTPPKKKKKIKPVAIVLPAVAVALAAVLIFTNVGYLIAATFTKWFGSDKAYMKIVEKHAISSYASTVTDYYEDYLTSNIDNARVEGSVSVSLGSQAKSLAKMYNIDLGDLDEAGFDFVYNSKGDRMMTLIALTMGGDDIASAELIFDGKQGAAYVKLKELTDKVLKAEIPDYSEIDTAKYKKAIKKMMPKPSTINHLVSKYAKIALNEIKDVDVYSETVEIDELSQKLTVVEYKISEETLYNIGLAAVKAAKKDKDIKKICKNIEEAYKDLDAELPVDIYDELIDGLDEAEEALDSASPSDDVLVTVYSYVNGSHEVVGREFSYGEDGDEKYGYVTVHDGKKYETRVDFGEIYCYGSGTEKNGKRTGEYTMYMNDREMVVFEFEDVDTKAVKKGVMKGTVRIKPGKEARSLIAKGISDSSIRRIVSSLDFALEIKTDITKKAGKASIGFLIDDAEFVTLNISTKRTSGKKIDLPDDDDVFDATDSDEVEEFLQDLDFDKILRNLKRAGLPEDLIDGLEDAISGIGRKTFAKSYNY